MTEESKTNVEGKGSVGKVDFEVFTRIDRMLLAYTLSLFIAEILSKIRVPDKQTGEMKEIRDEELRALKERLDKAIEVLMKSEETNTNSKN